MTQLSAPIYQLKRRAKLMARDEGLALHAALDRVAQDEGFAQWSLLSSQVTTEASETALLPKLVEGDLLLIGARPGQGKTRSGLRLLLDATRQGRGAVLFTLEYTEQEARKHLRTLGGNADEVGEVEVVASDDICADVVVQHLSDSARGTVAVIDYLQILDQRRSKPPLAEQMQVLKQFSRTGGFVFGFISQIDRSFDPKRESMPGMQDIRLPNPFEMGVFSKACFLHNGTLRFQDVA